MKKRKLKTEVKLIIVGLVMIAACFKVISIENNNAIRSCMNGGHSESYCNIVIK